MHGNSAYFNTTSTNPIMDEKGEKLLKSRRLATTVPSIIGRTSPIPWVGRTQTVEVLWNRQ